MNAPLDNLPTVSPKELNPVAVEDYLPARMINEAAYCHRLFYLMHVEGQFASSADTEEGSHVHSRVDQKTDALCTPKFKQPTLFNTVEPSPESESQETRLFSLSMDDSSLASSKTNDVETADEPKPELFQEKFMLAASLCRATHSALLPNSISSRGRDFE